MNSLPDKGTSEMMGAPETQGIWRIFVRADRNIGFYIWASLWYDLIWALRLFLCEKSCNMGKHLKGNIGITMNLYVHTTEEQKQKEIDQIADALKVV